MFDLLHAAISNLRNHIDVCFAANHTQTEKRFTNMDARIKQAIDDIAATKSIAQSVEAAFPILSQQIADLKQQIADIQARGDVATSADLDALAAAATDLEQTNAELAAAVPAKSPDEAAKAMGISNDGKGSESQPSAMA